MVVLRQRHVLHVVVAVGLRRIDVRQRQQVQQDLAVRIDFAPGNMPPCSQTADVFTPPPLELAQVRRVGEVAVAHRLRRHPRPQRAGVEVLLVVLVAEEEEQLVAVLVEVGAGNEQRTAEVEAREVELVLRLVLRTGRRVVHLVQEPLVRVHAVVPQVGVGGAAEVAAAGLRHDVDRRRALGVFGAEVRLEDLELLDHVGVRVHRGRAVAARVGAVGAVDDDVERVVVGAVRRVVADGALLAALAVAVDAV